MPTNRQQMKDPVLQMGLQSNLQPNLQEKPALNLQEDLQTDLQPNLQVRTGLEGTQQISSLVSFPLPLQAETSTEERSTSTSMGGTCKQGPIHVTGENLHSTWIYTLYGSTRVYTLHGSTRIPILHRSTRPTSSQDIHPNNIQCSHPEHPAIPNGNLVTHPSVTHPSVPGAVS